MAGPQSVTDWLDQLKAGDRDDAVARLWERYFSQLVRHARQHLSGRRAVADGEDVALVAFDAFVRAVDAGRFPKLDDRSDLWAVLLRMTANKARNAIRDENRERRGGGLMWHGIAETDSATSGVPVPSVDPDPADAAALAEGAEELLRALNCEELRQIALLAMEGWTNAEIGATIGKSVAAVERKRRLIRDIWSARASA
jgi:DNA-directed RNA polymerase specialized sigma24 family protein